MGLRSLFLISACGQRASERQRLELAQEVPQFCWVMLRRINPPTSPVGTIVVASGQWVGQDG